METLHGRWEPVETTDVFGADRYWMLRRRVFSGNIISREFMRDKLGSTKKFRTKKLAAIAAKEHNHND